MADVIDIRAHHLFLCLPAYVGKNYATVPTFGDNMAAIIGHIAEGKPVKIAEGPDHMCRAGFGPQCRPSFPHCEDWGVYKRDKVALRAANRAGVFSHPLTIGAEVVLNENNISLLRARFAEGVTRGACYRCGWSDTCTEIARRNFEGVKLLPETRPVDAVSPAARKLAHG